MTRISRKTNRRGLLAAAAVAALMGGSVARADTLIDSFEAGGFDFAGLE